MCRRGHQCETDASQPLTSSPGLTHVHNVPAHMHSTLCNPCMEETSKEIKVKVCAIQATLHSTDHDHTESKSEVRVGMLDLLQGKAPERPKINCAFSIRLGYATRQSFHARDANRIQLRPAWRMSSTGSEHALRTTASVSRQTHG